MGGLNFPSLDSAIASFEGYNTQGTVAARNNNPGNVVCGTFAAAHGSIGCETLPSGASFATFPTADAGYGAEDALISQYANQGATVSSLINSWAPPTAPGNSPAATQNYVNTVASQLGVDPNTPVSTLSGMGTSTGPNASPASLLGDIFGAATGVPGLSAGGVLGFARIGSFLLGLIMIAGGIYLFKPVQETVGRVARTGRRAAEALAV